MELITHVIDGEDVESGSGAKFDSVDPYTRTAYAEVALGGQKEVDRAVASARRAFDEGPWPRMGHAERGALLHRLADLVVEHGDELALADVTDMGKPISDARTRDVPRTAQNFRFFADHARLTTGETFPMDTGHHAYSLFQPAGVVAAISPWNFPLMLESWKIAPALAWGNTVVLKPAEDTPKSATLLARLAIEAGFPPGVLNVLHGFGPDSAGSALTQHRGVDRITFTGESGTARVIGRRRPPTSRRSASSSAARAPTWSSTTPTSTTPSPGRSRRSSPTPGRSASPARGSSSSAACTTSSWPGSSQRPRP